MTDPTFATKTLPNASKIAASPKILIKETTLLSGKRKVQSNANVGKSAKFRCFGSWNDYLATLALVGTKGDLVMYPSGGSTETWTNCYISGLSVAESDNPAWFYFDVEFVRETV